MILIKSPPEIKAMRKAGQITGLALKTAGKHVIAGVTTSQIDKIIRAEIERYGAKPSFLGYRQYPAASCISVNETVIHGIPGERKLAEGDIVSIDVGAFIDGFHGDSAATFAVGRISEEASQLIEAARQCFYEAIKFAREGNRLCQVSAAVHETAQSKGFSVVREFTGHGIGRSIHEDPEVPNFKFKGRGPELITGMTLAIEPMINAGSSEISILNDGWTVITADGKLSAHYEHTVLITGGEPEILTLVEGSI